MIGGALATLLGMGAVLVVSAFFSGAEAALFSLTPVDLRRFTDGSRAQKLARHLLEHPRRLLVTILLGNLLTHVSYFSLVGALGLRLATAGRAGAVVALSAGSLVVLILVGELLPKTLALRRPLVFGPLAAVPLFAVQQGILPVRAVLERVASATTRVIAGPAPVPPFLTSEELAWLVERGGEEGKLVASEMRMIREVLELPDVRVREVMTPRVELALADLSVGREPILTTLGDRPPARVLAHRGSMDEIVGEILVADLALRPDERLEDLVRPLRIVPESKPVEALLREMRREGFGAALVVDEYGGTEGLVTVEDLVEEIVGEIVDEEAGEEGVHLLADRDGGWSAHGRVAIRDVVAALGIEAPQEEVDTIGGLVAAVLGRPPRPGDAVVLGDRRVVVEEVRRRGIRRLRIDPPGTAGEVGS